MLKITQQRLKEVLHYDPETGIFVWLRRCGRGLPGVVAGNINRGNRGYRLIKIDRGQHTASRLAYLYMMGEYPPAQIDHKNGDSTDDRWVNLRPASPSQNRANTKTNKNNKCGFRGVVFEGEWHPTRPWRAVIYKDRRRISLGYFPTPDEAHRAYKQAAAELFGEFARPA